MNATIENLKNHYEDGLVIDGYLPTTEVINILQKENPGALVKITWTVVGKSYSARAGNLYESDIPYFICNPPVKRNFLFDFFLKRPVTPIEKRFVNFHLLPDRSGFIRFESGWDRPNNCLLLDAYGKERMRLTVPWELTLSPSAQQPIPQSGPLMIPWQLTGASSPDPDVYDITFGDISEPYINPADGKKGQFGVTGWVGDKYYFELDYHTGQFLWCKRIMD